MSAADAAVIRYLPEFLTADPSLEAYAWLQEVTELVARRVSLKDSQAQFYRGSPDVGDLQSQLLVRVAVENPERCGLINRTLTAEHPSAYFAKTLERLPSRNVLGLDAPQARTQNGRLRARAGLIQAELDEFPEDLVHLTPVSQELPDWVVENLDTPTQDDFDIWLDSIATVDGSQKLQPLRVRAVEAIMAQYEIQIPAQIFPRLVACTSQRAGDKENTDRSRRLEGCYRQTRFALLAYLHGSGQSDHPAVSELYADLDRNPTSNNWALLTKNLTAIGVTTEHQRQVIESIYFADSHQRELPLVVQRVLRNVLKNPSVARSPEYYESGEWERAAKTIVKAGTTTAPAHPHVVPATPALRAPQSHPQQPASPAPASLTF